MGGVRVQPDDGEQVNVHDNTIAHRVVEVGTRA